MRTQLHSIRRFLAPLVLLMVAASACGDAPAEPATAFPSTISASEISLNYDARLDLADACVEKAIILLQIAENPSAKNPDKPFGGHEKKAITHLEKARSEIFAAMVYADQSIQ